MQKKPMFRRGHLQLHQLRDMHAMLCTCMNEIATIVKPLPPVGDDVAVKVNRMGRCPKFYDIFVPNLSSNWTYVTKRKLNLLEKMI
jgi:hypothetical protein